MGWVHHGSPLLRGETTGFTGMGFRHGCQMIRRNEHLTCTPSMRGTSVSLCASKTLKHKRDGIPSHWEVGVFLPPLSAGWGWRWATGSHKEPWLLAPRCSELNDGPIPPGRGMELPSVSEVGAALFLNTKSGPHTASPTFCLAKSSLSKGCSRACGTRYVNMMGQNTTLAHMHSWPCSLEHSQAGSLLPTCLYCPACSSRVRHWPARRSPGTEPVYTGKAALGRNWRDFPFRPGRKTPLTWVWMLCGFSSTFGDFLRSLVHGARTEKL